MAFPKLCHLLLIPKGESRNLGIAFQLISVGGYPVCEDILFISSHIRMAYAYAVAMLRFWLNHGLV